MPYPSYLPKTLANWLVTSSPSGPLAVSTVAGRRWFPLWGVVYHRGRRSGREFRVPIVVFGHPDQILLPMLFGPESDWVKNVLAADGCVLNWRGWIWHLVEPRLLSPEEARPLFSTRAWRFSEMMVRPDGFLMLRREYSNDTLSPKRDMALDSSS